MRTPEGSEPLVALKPRKPRNRVSLRLSAEKLEKLGRTRRAVPFELCREFNLSLPDAPVRPLVALKPRRVLSPVARDLA